MMEYSMRKEDIKKLSGIEGVKVFGDVEKQEEVKIVLQKEIIDETLEYIERSVINGCKKDEMLPFSFENVKKIVRNTK